jgi:hypothetical protein
MLFTRRVYVWFLQESGRDSAVALQLLPPGTIAAAADTPLPGIYIRNSATVIWHALFVLNGQGGIAFLSNYSLTFIPGCCHGVMSPRCHIQRVHSIWTRLFLGCSCS